MNWQAICTFCIASFSFFQAVEAQMIPFAMWQRQVSAPSQQAYIKASNTVFDAPFNPASRFGYSVSVDGDTLAVGAYYEDSNATGIGGNQADNSASASGAVYVFKLK